MADYIPAYVQRYPFISIRASDGKEGEKVNCTLFIMKKHDLLFYIYRKGK